MNHTRPLRDDGRVKAISRELGGIGTKIYFLKGEGGMMEEINRVIGKRLQDVRRIYNNGFRCSVEQLASEIGESASNIRNYECGKAGIPNRVLLALYHKGINPIYIISGEGKIFAPNEAGSALEAKTIDNKMNNAQAVLRVATTPSAQGRGLAAAGSIINEILRKGNK